MFMSMFMAAPQGAARKLRRIFNAQLSFVTRHQRFHLRAAFFNASATRYIGFSKQL